MKSLLFFMETAVLLVIIIGIFEKMTSFSQTLEQNLEQGKLMADVNSWK